MQAQQLLLQQVASAARVQHITHHACRTSCCRQESGQWSAVDNPHLPGRSPLQANQILGLAPGEIFVQRNVGNQAMHTDLNLMACLEYAVKSLKVCAVCFC